jgi:hypothetical protein
VLLLGRDHAGPYGEYVCEVLGHGRTACTLSVGSDPETPANRYKAGDPNEDALLALDEARYCVLAVADAHYGAEAGHTLLERLNEAFEKDPPLTPARLERAVGELWGPAAADSRSASTLLISLFHRELGEGFGVSFGDSTLAVLGPGRPPRVVNRRFARFVAPGRPDAASPFLFSAGPDDLILAYTDGIDECCYGDPHRSVGPRHLTALLQETGREPEKYARALTELALAGVDGHPGGQDNIALIVSRTL